MDLLRQGCGCRVRRDRGQCKLSSGLTSLRSNRASRKLPLSLPDCKCCCFARDGAPDVRRDRDDHPPYRLALSAGGGEGFSPALSERSDARTEKSLSSHGTGPGAVPLAPGPVQAFVWRDVPLVQRRQPKPSTVPTRLRGCGALPENPPLDFLVLVLVLAHREQRGIAAGGGGVDGEYPLGGEAVQIARPADRGTSGLEPGELAEH